jgi:hypothetical protein
VLTDNSVGNDDGLLTKCASKAGDELRLEILELLDDLLRRVYMQRRHKDRERQREAICIGLALLQLMDECIGRSGYCRHSLRFPVSICIKRLVLQQGQRKCNARGRKELVEV